MAQNLAPKQINIASQMVQQSVTLWNALAALSELQVEYLQAGSFTDPNLATGNVPQLTAYLVGVMLSTVIPALATFMTTPLPNSGPVPRDIFLQVRP